MLSSDAAQDKLASMRDELWAATVHEVIAAVDGPKRDWLACALDRRRGLPLVGPDGVRRDIEAERNQPPHRDTVAINIVKKMDDAQRARFIREVVPRHAWAVEGALRILDRRPLSGCEFGVIRAPRNHAIQAQAKAEWLLDCLRQLGGFNAEVEELAGLSGFFEDYRGTWPWLIAGAIDSGGDRGQAVFDVLASCVRGEHPVGGVQLNVVKALTSSSRRDGWDLIMKLLLAAQRQEGLREHILDAASAAHPDAFKLICRVVLEHRLVRFSSVVRWADVWFGMLWDSAASKIVEDAITRALKHLDEPGTRARSVTKGPALDAYFALWASAFEDADQMLPLARTAMKSRDAEVRFAAVHAVANCEQSEYLSVLTDAIADTDLRVAGRAASAIADSGVLSDETPHTALVPTMSNLVDLLQRATAKAPKQPPALWPWMTRRVSGQEIGRAMLNCVTPETVEQLIPNLRRLGPDERFNAARLLANGGTYGSSQWPQADEKRSPISAAARTALLSLMADSSPRVVVEALRGMANRPIQADELDAVFDFLGRKNPEVRTATLLRLAGMEDARLLAFAERLLAATSAEQRIAGLEIVRLLVENGRIADQARDVVARWANARKKLSVPEKSRVEAIRTFDGNRPRRDNAFGLLNAENQSKPTAPRPLPILRMTQETWALLASAAQLIVKHRDLELPIVATHSKPDEPPVLGGERFWAAASPELQMSREENRARCPIVNLMDVWMTDTVAPAKRRDPAILLRACLAVKRFEISTSDWKERVGWPKPIAEKSRKAGLEITRVSRDAMEYWLEWASYFEDSPDHLSMILDSLEGAVAAGRFSKSGDEDDSDDDVSPDGELRATVRAWHDTFEEWTATRPTAEGAGLRSRQWALALAARGPAVGAWSQLTESQREQFWGQTHPSVLAFEPSFAVVLECALAGAITEDDLLDWTTHSYWTDESGHVGDLTDRRNRALLWHGKSARALELAERERRARESQIVRSAKARLTARLIELEIARGDSVTEATHMALVVRDAGGADICLRCLGALGEQPPSRGYGFNDYSRRRSLTSLIAHTRPAESDTPEAFARLARTHAISERAMIILGVFAPRWVRHVEHTLGWKGYEDAVWWIHAHTKGGSTAESDNQENLDALPSAITERTPLDSAALSDGGVDVAWFRRARDTLGKKRWDSLYEAAKYACTGAGHKRAHIFADAMNGGVKERELMQRIKAKRHQDSIRALGLVPLKSGKPGEAQVLARNKLMQEIRRTSRKHGGQMLQASEKRAVEIGMENLARTAGYPDPLRLQWAMEQLDVADLAKGPVVAKAGDVKVTLSISESGDPELTTEKAGKTLANIPPKVRKDKNIAALAERKTELRRSASRMRLALEQAMCRGDEFTGAELVNLFKHPILRPMLERLVFVRDGAEAGYPDKGGKVLRDHRAGLEPLKPSDVLRLAHPHDFLKRKDWSKWQRECFAAERVQPFKQVFRELYVLTDAERSGATECKRYENQQVNPRQAIALLGTRGWVNRDDEGYLRTFHKERLTARLEFMESFYTPAEVEGLTLRSIVFTKAGDWKQLKLAEIPPRVFSEAMRDLDLVVSVAHRAGVDPEASQSTVEMRAALVKETSSLLKLSNVTINGAWVRIKGDRAEYAVHLGSAGVQVMPGGKVWIVPVGAQHRGRLFLPFADDDPKTAEVVSKVLLLARDKEIQDPSIVEQIARFA